MSEDVANHTLALLRQMDEKLNRIDNKLDRAVEDLQNLKIRMTGTEEGLAGVNRRLDRAESQVQRIERRLDLVSHDV